MFRYLTVAACLALAGCKKAPPEELLGYVNLSHIHIAYQGAQGAPDSIHRTKDEARQRAEEALSRLKSDETFAMMGQDYNDEDRLKLRGGLMGRVALADLAPELARVAAHLKEGFISGVIEAPDGFHILKRNPTAWIHQIFITYEGARFGKGHAPLTREQALAKANAALAELKAGGDFEALAGKYSDQRDAKETGGDFGEIAPGWADPVVEKEAFALKPGEVSVEVLESRAGFYILKRIR